jgi:DNA-binding MarR family transcriptional regulator
VTTDDSRQRRRQDLTVTDLPGESVDPLAPDVLGARLADVFAVLGPLYRTTLRAIERNESLVGVAIGVRAVLEQIAAAGPQPVPRIAEALVLSRQFVRRMVNSAVEQGFAELRPNPAHRRSSLVALTAAGADAIADVKARELAVLRDATGDLTAGDIDACLRVLNTLTALMQEGSGASDDE